MLKGKDKNGNAEDSAVEDKPTTSVPALAPADAPEPSAWSNWEWSSEGFIFWRARKLPNDKWEYDYEHPESTSRVVSLGEKSKSLVSTAATGYFLAPQTEYIQEKSCEYIKEKDALYEGMEDGYTFAPIIQEVPISGVPKHVQEIPEPKRSENKPVDAGAAKAEFVKEEEIIEEKEPAQTEPASKPKSKEKKEHRKQDQDNDYYRPPRIRSEKLEYVEEWRRNVQEVLKDAPKGIQKKYPEMAKHRKLDDKRRLKSLKAKSRYIVEIVDD